MRKYLVMPVYDRRDDPKHRRDYEQYGNRFSNVSCIRARNKAHAAELASIRDGGHFDRKNKYAVVDFERVGFFETVMPEIDVIEVDE